MKTLIRNIAVAFGVLGCVYAQAKAVTVTDTISSTSLTGQSLLLMKNESLTYSLTGTCTGTILIEKSENARDYRSVGVSVTGTGSVSSSGKLYSGDRVTYFRWRASTVTAGSFTAVLYDNDDVVQEFKNNKNFPIVLIDDGGVTVSGTLVASSATLTATTLTSPTLNSPTLVTATITSPTVTGMTLSGTSTINGTITNNSTTTFTGTATFNGATSIKGTATNDSAAVGYVGEYVSSACANVAISTGVYNNICGSITLTAGDWDVVGQLNFFANSATYTRVDLEGAISTSNGDNVTGSTQGESYMVIDHTSGDTGWNYYPMTLTARKSIASTTTYYLKAYGGTTSAGLPKIWGMIKARRVR